MLGVPESSKSTLITKLASMPIVHKTIRVLRVQEIATRAFAIIPLQRRLRKSKLRYRVRHLESLLIADEIFGREIYREAFEGKDIQTFVDIGSNVGYFPLYVVEHTGQKDVRGLIVDANAEMARESRWHVDTAGLNYVHAVHGLVGCPSDVKEATFYVNASNVASSAQPELNPNVPAKGESRAVTVPAVDLLAEWRKLAGDRRIDLMKIDVEGFECDLLRNCADVLTITDRIVLEWHKWVTTQREVEQILSGYGFELRRVIAEDEHAGVGVYDRQPAA